MAEAQDAELKEFATKTRRELDVPGVSVGIFVDGAEHYAYAGVTSIRNPLPVDENTLFQFGSTTKTFTATAMMRLVERGDVELEAPVRRYLPEFALRDESAARDVTVLQLLNHTAGWEGDRSDNTGEGDDALERRVGLMKTLRQVYAPGSAMSYNNAAFPVAGRIIEKITGTTYEKAIQDLVLDPLGLHDTLFFMTDIMMRRFAVGHSQAEDGTIEQKRVWASARAAAPSGGMSATARDQISWARFHLGDGTAPDGTRLLRAETLRRMQEPTVTVPCSAFGDAVGISWLLRNIGETRLVLHGGATIGQYSDFMMVPSRQFAFTAMTNSGPNGPQFSQLLENWALKHYLGVVEEEPEPQYLPGAALQPYTGTYETMHALWQITAEAGRLIADVSIKPEMKESLRAAGEDPDHSPPPTPMGLLAGPEDRYVVPDGPTKGMKGFFTRDEVGSVIGVHIGGRLATRVAQVRR
ncbi:serine hydrolase domain-containing protein [Sorangium sp. So ce429]